MHLFFAKFRNLLQTRSLDPIRVSSGLYKRNSVERKKGDAGWAVAAGDLSINISDTIKELIR